MGLGAAGTILNLAAMSGFLHFGWNYLWSALAATQLTIIASILLQRRGVFLTLHGRTHSHSFSHSRRSKHGFLACLAVNNVGTAVRLPFVILLVEVIGVSGILAQGTTLAAACLIRFAFVSGSRYREPEKCLNSISTVQSSDTLDTLDTFTAPQRVRPSEAMTLDEVSSGVRDFRRLAPRAPIIVALIPAHNEETGIRRTVRSLHEQTVPPSFIIVMADNCTDNTIAVAAAAGAWVVETQDNEAKKAGALNQGLRAVMPYLQSNDYIICQDADGELAPDFLEEAIVTFGMIENLGGLSGAVIARPANNIIESSQAIEYARGMRLMSRNSGRVHVLSGAATVFPVEALQAVAEARGTQLPGRAGSCFMEDSLTEDYELTLAIKKLGYACSSTKRCKVVTDVMPTLKDLQIQRLRWFRGAMESMWLYGWSRLTHKIWLGIGWTFFVSLLFPASVLILTFSWIAYGTLPNLLFLLLFPLFAAEGIITARSIDRRARWLAVTFIPLWIYDNFMFVLYWRALFQALQHKSRVWIT